jgi:hypothetical protein
MQWLLRAVGSELARAPGQTRAPSRLRERPGQVPRQVGASYLIGKFFPVFFRETHLPILCWPNLIGKCFPVFFRENTYPYILGCLVVLCFPLVVWAAPGSPQEDSPRATQEATRRPLEAPRRAQEAFRGPPGGPGMSLHQFPSCPGVA